MYSEFIKSTIQKTNLLDYVEKDTINNYAHSELGYQNQYWPNCIDPTVFYDAEDRMWMVYGSWSGGIFLLELDETTGLPIHPEADEKNQVDPYFGKRLLGGYHQSIEGPYIMYDKETEYYYLFVSYGSLNSEGGYQIRLFRSKQVDGPYVDAKGSSMTMVDATNPEYNKEYGIKMMGNYNLPSLEVAYMAPGHNSAFIDADGKKYLVYHTRFDDGTEFHQPRVHQLFTNQSGWLVAAPFETNGETLKKEGYQKEEVSGKYYIINHGTDISKKIPDTELYHFYSNGDITAKDQEGNNKLIGKWSIEEQTSYITVTLNDVVYEGVMIEMLDEAGNQVKCISAVSNNNETIWGVCYV